MKRIILLLLGMILICSPFELLAQRKKKKEGTSKKITHKPLFIQEGIEDFENYFNSKVSISYKQDGKGIIQIPFDSQQDFSRMKKLLNREK